MATIDNQEFGPNKKKFRDDFSARFPDIDTNDEEAYYGALNDEYEQNSQNNARLKEFEEGERRLGEAFETDLRTAGLFLELTREGGKPLDYLIEHYSTDFADLINDPDNAEFREKLAKKQQEELQRITESKRLEKEAAENLEASLDALEEAGQELGLSDEQLADVFNQFSSFTEDLIKDKVSKDWWLIIAKGLSHDADVEQAATNGEVRGKNAKIKEKLSKERPSALNASSGGGMGTGNIKSELPGALGEREVPWYKR